VTSFVLDGVVESAVLVVVLIVEVAGIHLELVQAKVLDHLIPSIRTEGSHHLEDVPLLPSLEGRSFVRLLG